MSTPNSDPKVLRILRLSTLLLGLLLAVTFENLLGSLGDVSFLGVLRQGLFGLEGLTVATLLGYGLAAALVLFVWRDGRVGAIHPDKGLRTLAVEVVEEMTRVTWPTAGETRVATYAVIVATLVCAVMLGLFDYGWGMLTQAVYSR